MFFIEHIDGSSPRPCILHELKGPLMWYCMSSITIKVLFIELCLKKPHGNYFILFHWLKTTNQLRNWALWNHWHAFLCLVWLLPYILHVYLIYTSHTKYWGFTKTKNAKIMKGREFFFIIIPLYIAKFHFLRTLR